MFKRFKQFNWYYIKNALIIYACHFSFHVRPYKFFKPLQCAESPRIFLMNFPTRPTLGITRDVISLRRVHRLINPIKRRSLITREFFIQQISGCVWEVPVEQAAVIVGEGVHSKNSAFRALSFLGAVSKIRIVNGVQFIPRRRWA